MLPILEDLLTQLRKNRQTVATAESCTGGLVAAALTELPGSSDIYLGGVSAYSNAAKIKILQVDDHLIAAHGAVSEPVAQAMAANARRLFSADYGLSLTGIAGPGGASEGKPVGTVWCGLATPLGVSAVKWQLKGSRQAIREEAVLRALSWLGVACRA